MQRFLKWLGWPGIWVLLFISMLRIASAQPALISPTQEQAFTERLVETAQIANQRLLRQRALLLHYHYQHTQDQVLSAYAKKWLKSLAQRYKVEDFHLNHSNSWVTLIKRVDIVPLSLVIAQAANESAWGTSRFARTGHAYFGQACYVPGCGIVPQRRPADKHFEVQRFPSMLAATESYMRNLNTNPSYAKLRQLRQQLRQNNQPLSGFILASGLTHYAAIGEHYVRAIRGLIQRKQLAQYDQH